VSLTKRVDLGEGRWADVYTTRLHGVRVALDRLVARSKDDEEESVDFMSDAIRLLVTAWNLTSPVDGQPLAFSRSDVIAPAECRVELLPVPLIEQVYEAALEAWAEARAAEHGPPPSPPTSSG
jgi:hypothetical protein